MVNELDLAVRQIVSRAVVADGVVDIFAAAGLEKPDISILSEEFLSEVRDMPQRNLAVELLRKLLTGEIRTRRAKNVVQARSFAETLEQALRRYQNRAIEAAQVIEELLDLAREMREADRRGVDLGLTEDEVAFYDALEANDSAVMVLGEGPDQTVVDPLVAEVDRLVALGALGHLPVGGHKTRGAGWGRWRPQAWAVDDVRKARSWTPTREEPSPPAGAASTTGKEVGAAWSRWRGRDRETASVRVTSGSLEAVSPTLGEDIVRLHASARTSVELMEVADGSKVNPPTKDRAVARRSVPEPAESDRARRHGVELIQGGNLLGAWGAGRHLHGDEVEVRWTRVVEWLSRFAASLPIADECDIPVLRHPKMAVRAALRVEFALRAGDVPRAVHGTVAFFEAALWDGLNERVERSADPKRHRYFRIKSGAGPSDDKLLRLGDGSDEDRKRPFELKDTIDGVAWYWIYDGDGGPAARLAKRFLERDGLVAFDRALGSDIRELRNDVAHNEPTADLMEDARRRMLEASLWSTSSAFLHQPLVRNVLCELGEQNPASLCDDLVSTVRSRLLDAPR